jgi:hypothetical protein
MYKSSLILPGDQTVHIEVDPLKYFCGRDGEWAISQQDVGADNMTQLLAHPAIAAENIRRVNGHAKQLIVQSIYSPGQWMVKTSTMPTMCASEDDSQREIMLPGDVVEMADVVTKEQNSVFTSPEILEHLGITFSHLQIPSEQLHQAMIEAAEGKRDENSVVSIILHGVTGTSCISESAYAAFVPLFKELRLNFRIVIAEDSIASRDTSRAKHDQIVSGFADESNLGVVVVPTAEDISFA